MRCWFNNIGAMEAGDKITGVKKTEEWQSVMKDVFKELYRVISSDGYVAFEVGEARNGRVLLEEYIVDIGAEIGFQCLGVMIN